MKKLLTFLISILLVVMVVACTENVSAIGGDDIDDSNPIIDSVDDPQPIEFNPVVVDPDPEPVVAPDPEPEPEPEPQIDPNEQLTWDYLEVDEAWLKSIGGAVGLTRDGKLYAVSDALQPGNYERTGVGFKDNEDGLGFICSRGDSDGEQIIMDDRFIIPCVSAEDDLFWYGEAVSSIRLVPMDLPTYTVPIWRSDKWNKLEVFDNGKREMDVSHKNLTTIQDFQNKNIKLVDANENDVFLKFRDLNHGEIYTLKWNDGEDHEEALVAFWRYYKPTGEEAIIVTCIPTDDPQVSKIDFSSTPSGLYYIVEDYTLIEIRNN